MAKEPKSKAKPPPAPRNSLKLLHLGQAFAEYDKLMDDPNVFVRTPASLAAISPERGIFFFVGRRGTGKTATTLFTEKEQRRTYFLHPKIFSPFNLNLRTAQFANPKQKPYRSLVSAFHRALQDEVFAHWADHHQGEISSLPPQLRSEYSRYGVMDFDSRVVSMINELVGAITNQNENRWLADIGEPKKLAKELNALRTPVNGPYTLLIDRIDDYWDGSDEAVFLLSALMHAAAQLNTQFEWGRVLIFIRENMFERVRSIDPEFSRLETAVVGLEWTEEQLVELIERRFNSPFNTKLPLGGTTWNRYFEHPEAARELIFQVCQYRPRDVLIYCGFALNSAQSRNRETIQIEDLQAARRRFSDSRLKDLGDEYAENYPQIALVLSRFYGLGQQLAVSAIDDLLKKLLADREVIKSCGTWIYDHSTPELFVRLLYNIGFLGVKKRGDTFYRSLGPRDTTPPPLSLKTDLVVHPSYWDALDLQDALTASIDTDAPFSTPGFVADLPGSLDLSSYTEKLENLIAELETIPAGPTHASEFEDLVGEVLKMCFFRYLTNPEPKQRTIDGKLIRDWVMSNRASSGFWEMIRVRYDATQVVWECKNYEKLKADDFHQIAYYLNDRFGRFGVIAFRGDVSPGDLAHIKRIAEEKRAMVVLLRDRDLLVFLRQAKNGKVKDDHIQDRFDEIVRAIS